MCRSAIGQIIRNLITAVIFRESLPLSPFREELGLKLSIDRCYGFTARIALAVSQSVIVMFTQPRDITVLSAAAFSFP